MFNVQFITFDCCKLLGDFLAQNQLHVCKSVQAQLQLLKCCLVELIKMLIKYIIVTWFPEVFET